MNPFREGIVASPWETTGVDVNAIHDDVFQECLRGIERVRHDHRSTSLLIHGGAGSGKTHLLKRLRARLTPQVPPSTDREECLYVWVRLQTSPRMIWRTIRRTLVEDWFRPVRGVRSQFERILFHRLAQIRTAEGDLERWYEYMLDNAPDGLKELMDRIATSLHLDRNTAVAFEHIAFHRHIRDLRAWLCGDSLPEAALARMDLSQDEGTDEERESLARQVVIMLCRLAGDSLPILITFDQVEALEMFPGDFDGLYAFAQVTSTLHDETSNVFLVSSVQSAYATRLKDKARGADYDRMTSLGALALHPLNKAQAEQLIAARLNAVPQSRPDESVPLCWPLEPHEFEELFEKQQVTPRQLLSVCAERFEIVSRGGNVTSPVPPVGSQHPRGAAIPPTRAEIVESFLKDKWDSVREEKLGSNAPEKTEEIVRHGLPMLVKLVAPDANPVRDEQLQDVPIIFEHEGARTGVSICTQSNMTSLAATLKRLKTQLATHRIKRLAIVRDNRVPVNAGAKAAKKHLDELEQDPRTVTLRPAPEILAALDALRGLLSDAKSGDLSCHDEAISPQTLEAWLTAHLPDGLRDLADSLFGKSTDSARAGKSDSHDLEALNTLLASRPVVRLDEAIQELQKSREALTELVRKYPDQISLLAGPPEVLFRTVRTNVVEDK
jgi:hypothetical protein